MEKRGKAFLGIVLLAFLLTGWASAKGQNLVVIPPDTVLAPGQGVKFEAHVFQEDGTPLQGVEIRWMVEPDTLGSITEDGFFTAGPNPGEGKIIAIAHVFNLQLKTEIEVKIASPALPRVRVEIRPKEVAVSPGEQVQFRARALDPAGNIIPNVHFRWKVRPRNLGWITGDGLFTAGNQTGLGYVIAMAEIRGHVYKGRAVVAVGLEPTAQLSGTVEDEALGTPIEDARVVALRLGPIPWIKRARTDSLGNYTINELIPGVYIVWAKANGYVREYYEEAQFLEEATPLRVAEGDSLTGIDFTLSRGGTITGVVLEDTGMLPVIVPIEGAHVVAELVVKPWIKYHTFSETDGTYKLEGLPGGFYYVYAEKPGYAREYYDDAPDRAHATIVEVQEGATVEDIDFSLEVRSAIVGFVFSEADTTPVQGAIVCAQPIWESPGTHARRAATDANGRYILPVRPGWYIVSATAKGFLKEYYDDADSVQDATPVEVVEGQHTRDVNFYLTPLAVISGTVVDQETGEPIFGARVIAFPEAYFARPYIAFTDSNGVYEIKNVRPGTYLIKATAEGYLPEFYEEAPDRQSATPVVVEAGDVITGIDFTLTKGGAISGVVLSELTTEPIPRAVVTAICLDYSFQKWAFSDSTGHYRITGLPAGNYIVMANARGYAPEYYDNVPTPDLATPVEVTPPDEVTDINFTLMPIVSPTGGIAGTVTSEFTDMPIPGAWVIAIPLRPGRLHLTRTGPNGNYLLLGLKTGAYYVLAWAPGFMAEFYDNAHNWQDADPVRVEAPNITQGIDFSLTPRRIGPYTIRGRVVSRGDGRPLEEALVFAQEHRSGEMAGFATTDNRGRFEISGVPPGQYRVFAMKVGFVSPSEATDSTSVNVGEGQDAEGIELALASTGTGIEAKGEASVPQTFALFQNMPNPFNPSTEIRFQLPTSCRVVLKVYNILGQEVRTLMEEQKAAGLYRISWDGRDDFGNPVPSGIYFLRLRAEKAGTTQYSAMKKMILVR